MYYLRSRSNSSCGFGFGLSVVESVSGQTVLFSSASKASLPSLLLYLGKLYFVCVEAFE